MSAEFTDEQLAIINEVDGLLKVLASPENLKIRFQDQLSIDQVHLATLLGNLGEILADFTAETNLNYVERKYRYAKQLTEKRSKYMAGGIPHTDVSLKSEAEIETYEIRKAEVESQRCTDAIVGLMNGVEKTLTAIRDRIRVLESERLNMARG